MFLSELSCVMLYGKLPPSFWNKGGDPEKHFRTTLKKLVAWMKRDRKTFSSVDGVLYQIYTQYYKDMIAGDSHDTESSMDVRRVIEDEEEDENVDLDECFEVDERAARRSEGVLSLRTKDG